LKQGIKKMVVKKLVVGITAPGSVVLIVGQLKHFKDLGYKTYLLAPSHERVFAYCKEEGCEHLPINISREISFFKDFKSLFQIFSHFRRVKPDIINLGTPKVSLLGMIAGFLLKIPNRIYTCRGFRFEHESGIKQRILIEMEKITVKASHKVICISSSLKELGFDFGIFNKEKKNVLVINKGSSNGIDLKFFNPHLINTSSKDKLAISLSLNQNFVFGFVGRFIDRKGINELFAAFCKVYELNSKARLLIIGSVEQDQVAKIDLLKEMQIHSGVIFTGPQMNVPLYLSLMDVFVLPAWWEGFGNVLVQAAAMGVPVISTNATGCKDAVSNEFNGILVKPRSVDDLYEGMVKLLENPELRETLGNNGKVWAKNFDSTIIWKGMGEIYNTAN